MTFSEPTILACHVGGICITAGGACRNHYRCKQKYLILDVFMEFHEPDIIICPKGAIKLLQLLYKCIEIIMFIRYP